MNEDDKISVNMPTEWKYNRQSVIMPMEERIDPVMTELIALQQQRLLELTKQIEEDAMRDTNPTLKNAWDHYQMLLKLIKEE